MDTWTTHSGHGRVKQTSLLSLIQAHICRTWEGFHPEKHVKQSSPAALMAVLENSPVLCAYGLIRSGGTEPIVEGASTSNTLYGPALSGLRLRNSVAATHLYAIAARVLCCSRLHVSCKLLQSPSVLQYSFLKQCWFTQTLVPADRLGHGKVLLCRQSRWRWRRHSGPCRSRQKCQLPRGHRC